MNEDAGQRLTNRFQSGYQCLLEPVKAQFDMFDGRRPLSLDGEPNRR